jgi:hypothetical protein
MIPICFCFALFIAEELTTHIGDRRALKSIFFRFLESMNIQAIRDCALGDNYEVISANRGGPKQISSFLIAKERGTINMAREAFLRLFIFLAILSGILVVEAGAQCIRIILHKLRNCDC